MKDCIFCSIASKSIPAEIVHEDDELVAFKDTSPQAPVHLLVIPKQHIDSVDSLTDDDTELLGRMIRLATTLGKQHAPDGCRIALNTGQHLDINHLHIHIVGGKDQLGSIA